ncbi:hypothetical protein C8Q77DRAFT_1075782 [Trametes polyzona]|nr:hypothetical protein C8Q77DRAFT_1075782 [Trametes polyzona]
MALYPALANVDIVERIVWHLDVLAPGRYSTLLRFALVCVRFRDPALSALWRECSVLQLLRLFSTTKVVGVREDPTRDYGSTTLPVYALTEDPSSSECSRFRLYAAYVQKLYNRPGPWIDGWDIDPATWGFMEHAFGNVSLFPNLKDLRWFVDLSAPYAIVNFLSPSIRRLYFNCTTRYDPVDTEEERQRTLAEILGSIRANTPGVADIQMKLGAVYISAALLSPLYHLRALRRFKFTVYDSKVDYDALQGLTALDLEFLSIKVEVNPSPGTILRPLTFRRLLRLEIRTLYGDHPVFDNFVSPTLRELDIWRAQYINEHILRRSCAAWAQNFPSLRSLTIKFRQEDNRGAVMPNPQPTLSDTIAPLLDISSIQIIKVELWHLVPFTVGDEDIVRISHAWPKLTTLDLFVWAFNFPGGDPHASRILAAFSLTTAALSALASGCPHLHTLRLPHVRSGLRAATEEQDASVGDHRLCYLFLPDAEPVDQVAFDRFVGATFPHLAQYDCRGWQGLFAGRLGGMGGGSGVAA